MGQRGPDPQPFTEAERDEILRLLRGGFGINMVLHQMKVGRSKFYRIFKEDKEFREDVRSARGFDRDYLFFLRRQLAVGDPDNNVPPDPSGLEFLIRQHAAAERFGWERRESAKARRDAREAARMAAMGPSTGDRMIKVEYEDPDARLHRPADAEAPPPPRGAEEDHR